jgi:hypothetical protein
MRKHGPLGLLVLFYGAFAGFAAWAFYKGASIGRGWESLSQAWPYLLAEALTVAAVTAVLVWVAFYSERHGYDMRAGRDEP